MLNKLWMTSKRLVKGDGQMGRLAIEFEKESELSARLANDHDIFSVGFVSLFNGISTFEEQ